MDKPNAIVIFYSGTRIDTVTVEQLLGAIAKHVADGASQATIKLFDENDLSSELVRSSIPPKRSTEEGDAAVKVVMGLLPITCKDNKLKCCVALTKLLSHAEFQDDAKSKAFINAMSILSQNYPVSNQVATDWNFTETIRDAIKETYYLFINA